MKHPCILVADDTLPVRDLLEIFFRQEGFQVIAAADGQEAVRLFEASGGEVDVVLLDVRMPGLSGPHTLARLRQLDPAIRCVFMSGHTGPFDPRELNAMEDIEVVDKPFSLAGLAQTVREVLARE